MKIFFVTALTGLTVSEPLGRGERLDEVTYITNEVTAFDKYITGAFRRSAGTLEANFIRDATACVYGTEDVPQDIDVQKYLLDKMADLGMLLTTLWLIKDNAINHETVFAAYSRDLRDWLDSNAHAARFSTSTGATGTTIFTRRELAEARRLVRERFEPQGFIDPGSAAAVESAGRFDRAVYFSQAARGSPDVGLKIANYCSAFEAVFASGRTELTHTLAERVASFLESTPTNRLALYRQVKKAYDFRSLVVHGGFAKRSKSPELVAAAEVLDRTLRRVFLSLLSDRVQRVLIELPDQDFSEAFLLRVFGSSWDDLVDEEDGEDLNPEVE